MSIDLLIGLNYISSAGKVIRSYLLHTADHCNINEIKIYSEKRGKSVMSPSVDTTYSIFSPRVASFFFLGPFFH